MTQAEKVLNAIADLVDNLPYQTTCILVSASGSILVVDEQGKVHPLKAKAE